MSLVSRMTQIMAARRASPWKKCPVIMVDLDRSAQLSLLNRSLDGWMVKYIHTYGEGGLPSVCIRAGIPMFFDVSSEPFYTQVIFTQCAI